MSSLEERIADLERVVGELLALSARMTFVRVGEFHIVWPWASRSEWRKLIRIGLLPTKGVRGTKIRIVAVADVLKLVHDVKHLDSARFFRFIAIANRSPSNGDAARSSDGPSC